MSDIDGFVEYVIRELCEGCTECEPRLPVDWMNTKHLCCTTEGKVKWLLDLKERYKHEQDEPVSAGRGRRQQVKQDKKQTIPEIIEEVKCEICDNYCKYPDVLDDDEVLAGMCEQCPLGRLG